MRQVAAEGKKNNATTMMQILYASGIFITHQQPDRERKSFQREDRWRETEGDLEALEKGREWQLWEMGRR